MTGTQTCAFLIVAEGAQVSFVANVIDNLGLYKRTATLHSGTTANSATVDWRGTLSVSSGGTVSSATVSGYFPLLSVASGGVVSAATVNSFGTLSVSSGGVVSAGAVNGDTLSVSSGGTVSSATVDGGTLSVSSDGVVSATTVNRGTLLITSGADIQNVTVSSGGVVSGALNLHSAYSLDLHSGGQLISSTATPRFSSPMAYPAGETQTEGTCFIRIHFEVDQPIQRVLLQTACDDHIANLYLNGILLEQEWASDWRQTNVVELPPENLSSGANLLAVEYVNTGGASGLMGDLKLVYADGSYIVVTADHAIGTMNEVPFD